MSMMPYRKNSEYLKPGIVHLPANEFDAYLKLHPHLIEEAEKYQWNINNRYKANIPTTNEEWSKMFAISPEYIQRSAKPRHWKYALHREMLKHYINHTMGCILDFGCGAGNDGIMYASLGYKVVFSDVDGIGLEFIRWRLAQRSITGCHVIPSNQKFEDQGLFDVVLLIDCMEHIPNSEEYFMRIHNAISPGGILYLSFSSGGTDMDCFSHEDFNQKILPTISKHYDHLEHGIYRRKK